MSLKMYDYKCESCGYVFEELGEDNAIVYCKKCRCYTKRILGVPGGTNANQDAEWIRSVREVVDKEGGAHCQEFLKNPTRGNYNKWKKVEGVRDFEQGEKPRKPDPVDVAAITKDVWRRDQERNRITVR